MGLTIQSRERNAFMEYIVTLHIIYCFFLIILQSVLLLPYAMREEHDLKKAECDEIWSYGS
jgi:hypothetical protein